MMRVLGIDPGLNVTGYGILDSSADPQVVTAGDIRLPQAKALAERLEILYHKLSEVIRRYHPATMVLEMVFTHERYVSTAARMAHARGVACLAAQEHKMVVAEYPPARVKKALTGNGNASKTQVARMLSQWLGDIETGLSADATDALALAFAHTQMASGRLVLGAVK